MTKLNRMLALKHDQFNWFDALAYCTKHPKRVTKKQHTNLSARANNWVTCACGQLCKKLPRNPKWGFPEDGKLRDLGMLFAENITAQDWRTAHARLIEIEQRTSKLLRKV